MTKRLSVRRVRKDVEILQQAIDEFVSSLPDLQGSRASAQVSLLGARRIIYSAKKMEASLKQAIKKQCYTHEFPN